MKKSIKEGIAEQRLLTSHCFCSECKAITHLYVHGNLGLSTSQAQCAYQISFNPNSILTKLHL